MQTKVKWTKLYSDANGSDKIYEVWLMDNMDGTFDVVGANAPRGQRLKEQAPKPAGVDEATALKAYAKLIRDKVTGSSKYRVIEEGGSDAPIAAAIQAQREGASAGVPVQLLNAVSASELNELLDHPQMRWMRKINGWRNGLIVKESVDGFSKKGQIVPVSADIAAAARIAFPESTIDAELVNGVIYAYDALTLKGRDLTGLGFEERHDLLTAAARRSPEAVFVPNTPYPQATGKRIVVVPYVKPNDARTFVARARELHLEGVVGRHADAPITDGRRSGERINVKFKFYASLTAEVIRHNAGASVGIGVYRDDGSLFDLGNVKVDPRPPIGSFVEVRYQPSRPGRKLDQPCFLMVRPPNDANRADCSHDQIVYAASELA